MKAQNTISLFQVSEIQLSYYPKFKASERPKVTSSKDAYRIFYENLNLGKLQLCEQFYIMLLNRSNKVIGISEISTGGVTGTVADPKLIFATALKANACQLILAHNHPSGNLTPSEQDIMLTKKIVEGGKMLDIPILDHIILTNEGYYSFGDERLI
jgi:DNA repair protein RadC